MFRWRGATLAAKAGYGFGCVAAALILVVSGFAYFVKAQVGGIGGSDVLNGGPQTGAMNILLMGLESRTDYNGNTLSSQLLTAMHAGSVYGVNNEGVGGQDTNTLILIHIFAGGQKAVGFSVPRDDWVTYPKSYDGQGQGKIDQAYGLAYAQSLAQTGNSGESHDERYLQANEAGQAATIATVEQVTGQHIDHFAEVNLAGFFELAQDFGGVEVCLKSWNGGQNLHDANSGFNQSSPGYHLLAADQALAFVRERDNLPNGDLDRTHRQQAVLDYVIWKLDHQGILTSIGQLTTLLDQAKQYLITDQGWDILDFASEMHALTGKNLTFQTLPVVGYQTFYIGGTAQDANVINIPAIQAEVRQAFGPPTPSAGRSKAQAPSYPASATTVDVYNAGYTSGMAGQVMTGLVAKGFTQGQTATASARQSTTQVLYGSGAATKANAAKIAAYFGVTPRSSGAVSANAVEVIVGSSMTALPAGLSSTSTTGTTSAGTGPSGAASSGAASADAAPSPSSSSGSSATGNGAAGGAVQVKGNAPYGIPCVY
jgi:LCP family protein required for cell wall assembly